MVLVLALLLTTLCGVHSASIPSNSLYIKLASKPANMLDKRDSPNLEKIRRSVLEDMKRLLDTQLAALFESAVKQKTDAQNKRLKLKTKLHPTVNTGDRAPLDSDIPNEPQNSDFIKVLSDGSLQDPNDEVLRNAVDQLLQEDEHKAADSIEKGGEILYSNEDQLNGDNSTKNNSEEIIHVDTFDDAPLPPININDKDRNNDEIHNKRGISHVIIEHVPKTVKKYDENEMPDNILDLDEIIKSAVKDLSGSQEDERNEFIDLEDTDSFTHNIYPKSSQKKVSRISNYSQAKPKIHDPHNNSFQVNRVKNVNIHETEQFVNSKENEKSDNGALETRFNSVIEPENLKTQHHKHYHTHRKNHRDRQPITQSHSAENNRNNRDDTQGAGKNVNKDDIDIQDLRNGENDDELRKHHNERLSNEKSKKQHEHNGNDSNIKQHSRHHHNRNHDKHKHHSDNEKHDRSANQHFIVRLISDSNGSNESSLDNMNDKKPTHKKAIHSISSDLSKRLHQDIKETSNNTHSYNMFASRENTINKVSVSHDASEDGNNLAEIQNLSIKQKINSTEGDINIIKNTEYDSEEADYLIESRNDTKKESNFSNDEKPVAREGDKKTPKTMKIERGKNINNDYNLLFGDEGNGNANENDATKEIENKAKGTGDIQATKIRGMDENDSKDNKAVTKNDIKSKKHETHCHHESNEQMSIESDQLNIIRDLMKNKELKKSYSVSLTLSTK